MKATVENQIVNPTALKSVSFVELLNLVNKCADEQTLRFLLKREFEVTNTILAGYFEYGFGHNHMWVVDKDSLQRILFVEL